MKIKSSVKQICDKCKRIKRYKKFVNICLYHPKHKHRQ